MAPAPVADHAAFDDKMRTTLENTAAPYQSMHWDMLAQKMDNSTLIRRVRTHKVVEAVIMLLLLLNFQAVMNTSTRLFNFPPAEVAPQEQERPRADAKPAGKNRKSGEMATIGAAIELPAPAFATSSNALQSMYALMGDNPAVAIPATLLVPATLGAAVMIPGREEIPGGLRPLTLLAALGLEALDYPQQPRPMAGLIQADISRTAAEAKSRKTYLMAFAGWNNNRLKEATGYNTRFNNTAVGAKVGARRGKWGIETGVAYSKQRYTNETHVASLFKENGITYGISPDQTNAEMVSVPVKVTARIARWGRTSVHLTGGGSANIAATKNTGYKKVEFPALPSSLPLPNTPPETPAANGWFENGSFATNSYATLDAGVRLEQKISGRFAAFIEPQISRQVAGKGYGATSSHTNTIGFQAGLISML